jgi:hypothetical protein
VCPSEDLHREVSLLVLKRDGKRVQKLMDSTSHVHGGRHREDEVHSLGGLAMELARRGELTADRMAEGLIHQAVDEAWSRAMKGLPIRGPMRQPAKRLLEAAVSEALRASRRRRR